jgi:predicted metal-dependent hydrolase
MTSSGTHLDAGIHYTITYSRRRTVGITVERDGSVVVRVPEGTPEEDVKRFVSAKARWISNKIHHPQKYQGVAHPPGKELVSGESMLYLGHNYRVEIVESSSDRIKFDEGFMVPRSLGDRARDEFRRWYRQAANERLVPRVCDWATQLGVEPTQIRIADVRYRWGSCTPAGSVRLNWRLIKAPVAVSDYVIVHELAHLLESSHGDRFWSIVRSQVPRVETSRAWLREHGELLELDL